MKRLIARWPVLRQLREGDPLGLGRAAQSGRSQRLRARISDVDSVVPSICPFCAVGCGQLIYVKDGEITHIEGDPASPISRGRLCPKGQASKSYAQSPLRECKVKYRPPRTRAAAFRSAGSGAPSSTTCATAASWLVFTIVGSPATSSAKPRTRGAGRRSQVTQCHEALERPARFAREARDTVLLARMGGVEREDWNRRFEERGLVHGGEPDPTVVAEVEALPPGRALDLGCGQGRHAAWLAAKGWQVTAVDFSDVALATARAAEPEVEWVQADLREYRPQEGAFDLVLYAFVQLPEHERRAVLARAAAALAPGGTLLVVGHDLLNLTEGWAGPSDPSVLFTPDDVVGELQGLAIERADRVRRPVTDEDGRSQVQVDAVVRAIASA
jgi:SAM-dependent methyltransferase